MALNSRCAQFTWLSLNGTVVPALQYNTISFPLCFLRSTEPLLRPKDQRKTGPLFGFPGSNIPGTSLSLGTPCDFQLGAGRLSWYVSSYFAIFFPLFEDMFPTVFLDIDIEHWYLPYISQYISAKSEISLKFSGTICWNLCGDPLVAVPTTCAGCAADRWLQSQ